MIFDKVERLLEQIKDSLSQINNDEYNTPIEAFDNATLGQHTRHVVEHFQCLVKSKMTRFINYDDRKRSLILETDIESCISAIDHINQELRSEDFEVEISQDFLKTSSNTGSIKSSFFREILYNMDHLVHHQALMKIGFKQIKPHMHLGKHFGYADATINHKQNVHAELPST